MRHEPYRANPGEVFTRLDRVNGGYILIQRVNNKDVVTGGKNFDSYEQAESWAHGNEQALRARAPGVKVFMPIDLDD